MADIAWPIVSLQQLQRAIGNGQRAKAGLLANAAEEMARKCRDIACSLSQSRERNQCRRKQFEQLLAELAGFHKLAQWEVAGREYAHIDAETMGRTKWTHDSL